MKKEMIDRAERLIAAINNDRHLTPTEKYDRLLLLDLAIESRHEETVVIKDTTSNEDERTREVE